LQFPVTFHGNQGGVDFPMALVMRFCASAIVPTDEAAFFSISALRISAAFFS